MVLLVVDTQKLITGKHLYAFEQFEKNVQTIISEARKNKIEVIYVRHDDGKENELTRGKEGFEIYEKFAPQKGEKIFDKACNSAFKETGLLDYLNEKQETQVIIVGLQTDYCIDATIKCGFEHGLEMIVPAYCNTTVDNQYMTAKQSYHYYNEMMWPRRYAKCLPFEEVLSLMK